MALSTDLVSWYQNKLEYTLYFYEKDFQKKTPIIHTLPYMELCKRVSQAKKARDIQEVCYTIANHYGYNHFSFAFLIPPSKIKKSGKFACHHLYGKANEWTNYYKDNLRFVDPFTNDCLTSSVPLLWKNSLAEHKKLMRASPSMSQAFQEFSVNNIVSIPYRGADGRLLCLRLGCFGRQQLQMKDVKAYLPDLMLIAAYLMEAATKIFSDKNYRTALRRHEVSLTRREYQVLECMVLGHSSQSISIMLGVSVNTVLTHTKNLYRKLGVNNRQLAIVRALSSGLLEKT